MHQQWCAANADPWVWVLVAEKAVEMMVDTDRASSQPQGARRSPGDRQGGLALGSKMLVVAAGTLVASMLVVTPTGALEGDPAARAAVGTSSPSPHRPRVAAPGVGDSMATKRNSPGIVSLHPGRFRVGDLVRMRTRPRLPHGVKVRVRGVSRFGTAVIRTRPVNNGVRVRVPDRMLALLPPGGGRGAWVRFRLATGNHLGPPSPRARLLPPAPEPPVVPAPDNPVAVPPAREVLSYSDFDYLGAFRLPEHACGWTTAYSSSGIAIRRVGSELRFFSAVHVYSGSLVYEVAFPGVGTDPSTWPTATVAAEPCDLYGGRKHLGDAPEPFDGSTWTHGLFFDDQSQRLYWSFGDVYNADTSNDHFLGATVFSDASSTRSLGPWVTSDPENAHAQRVRGGVLRIPQWFADTYIGGRTLGIGFGGYFSIIGPGSMGPTLFATTEPGEAELVDPVPLLAHPVPVAQSDQWALRPTNYSIAANLDWGRGPDSRGYWAPGDSIEGGAVWIDEPSRHGVLYFAELNTGRIAYEFGGLQADDHRPYWYIYDPQDLADVALGNRQPWQVDPAEISAVDYPATGEGQDASTGAVRRVAGAAYDRVSHTLYVEVLNGFQGDGEQFPVIHAYRLKNP